jgi:hypothetical protein
MTGTLMGLLDSFAASRLTVQDHQSLQNGAQSFSNFLLGSEAI